MALKMLQDWDVDSYKTEFENEEHWELRKKFMLAHKDKFPENELVCLAQVFTNIEFLGCRYPNDTMIRVAELAKGVVEEFREARKKSLKRTLVGSAEAASSKVKGQGGKKQRTESSVSNTSQGSLSNLSRRNDQQEYQSAQVSKRIPKYGGVKTFDINQRREPVPNKPLGNFVLFLSMGDHPVSEIQRSAALNSVTPRWDFEEGAGSLKVCKLYFDDQFVATGVGENMKNSKENTAKAAIAKLRESYFTVKVKFKFFSNMVVGSSDLKSASGQSSTPGELGEDNIGRKLMKLMGWSGGGLGKQEQGIEEPIAVNLHVQREGFGHIQNGGNIKEFKKQVRDYIQNWMNSNSDQDLVFSKEFDTEERKVIHEIAKQYSLKSKSYGKFAERHLVVSRKAGPWDIVESLKKTGGSSDKYELLYPTRGC